MLNKLKRVLIASALTVAALAVPNAAHAAAMTNYLENKVVDWMLRGQTFTPPTSTYFALFTACPTDAAGGTEVSGGNYARVALASSLANWAGTQGAGTTVASSGTGGQTSNNIAVTFPAPTASWGVFDASSAGNLLIYAPLTINKTINNGDAAPSFPAGGATFTVDN